MDSEELVALRSYHAARIAQERHLISRASNRHAADAHERLLWLHQCKLSSLDPPEGLSRLDPSVAPETRTARVIEEMKRAFGSTTPHTAVDPANNYYREPEQ